MQQAFHDNHVLQCGFCTPGMIMQAIDLLGDDPDPDEQTVREGLEGNLCRCTGYQNIVRAVLDAAQKMQPAAASPRHVSAQQPSTGAPSTGAPSTGAPSTGAPSTGAPNTVAAGGN